MLERVLPLPPKLYEQIVGAAVEEGYLLFWQQPASVILNRMESFLVKKKAACLAAYEHQIWTEVHDYENYTFDNYESDCSSDQHEVESVEQSKTVSSTQLRKLRNKIYARLSTKQSVKKHLKQYEYLTEAFIQQFGTELSVTKVKILKHRLKRTRNSAGSSKVLYNKKHRGDVDFKKFEITIPTSESLLYEGSIDHEVDVDGAKSMSGSEQIDNCDKTPETCDQNESGFNQQFMRIQEQDVFIFPDVPEDSESDLVDTAVHDNSIDDDEILRRLIRLKFFSKAWFQSAASSNESPSNSSCLKNDTSSEMKVYKEKVAVTSTDSDRQAFNEWYYAKNDQLQKYKSQIN